jgi:gamma-glutamyltranspeptidase/glutathione hydrolase
MAGTLLARDGDVGLVVGSPGSRRIISAVVQVVSRWVDGGESLQAAVAGARVHAVTDEEVFVEREPPRSVLLALERRGFSVSKPLSSLFQANRSPYFGGVHAVAREGNEWVGAADPRRDGAVRVARIATGP